MAASKLSSRASIVAVLALGAWLCGGRVFAADVTVDDSGDVLHSPGCATTGQGTCTLRDAITFANANPGPDTIRFAEAHLVVYPTSALPPISDRLTLDAGYNLLLNFGPAIDGSRAGSADGLVLDANESSILGLEVRNFEGTAIVVRGSNNRVGQFFPCVLGACQLFGVVVRGNGGHGIEVRGGSSNVLENVRAEVNGGHGFYVHAGAASNQIRRTTFHPVGWSYGNQLSGVKIGDGPADVTTTGNSVELTVVSGNGNPQIDLGGDGPTANDVLDADTGPNGFQNFPVVTSAVSNGGGNATVTGTMNGTPNELHTLRFYRADTGSDPFDGNKLTVTTDGAGFASFSSVISFGASPPPAGVSVPLVATATNAAGSTSELSGPVIAPPPTPMAFHTLEPCRLLDTRLDRTVTGVQGGLALARGRPRLLTARSYCGLPATAQALALNVTVTNATAAGHVSLATAPWAAAATSTLNFRAGQTRANSTVVAVDALGNLAATAILEAPGTLDLVVDVSGYFE